MKSYRENEKVSLDVNVLTSPESPVSYDFYQQQLGTCEYTEKILQSHGLGAIMFGDRIYSSSFEIRMLKNVPCEILCRKFLNKQQISFLIDKIRLNYTHNWLIDQLPVAQPYLIQEEDIFYRLGFPLGVAPNVKYPQEVVIYNHYNFILEYHKVEGKITEPIQYRVVGALIEPKSLAHPMDSEEGNLTCSKDTLWHYLRPNLTESDIYYTYSIQWIENKNISWATRWDQYLKTANMEIHRFSMILPLSTVFFLTGLVALILVRTLRLDLYKYNRVDPDRIQEETGWKLMSTEVLRPPKHRSIFCAFIGTGSHIICMTAVTISKI